MVGDGCMRSEVLGNAAAGFNVPAVFTGLKNMSNYVKMQGIQVILIITLSLASKEIDCVISELFNNEVTSNKQNNHFGGHGVAMMY